MQIFLGKCLRWIIDLVTEHNITISKYIPLAGNSFIKLPKELNHVKKVWLIFKILMIMNALNGI